MFMRCSFHFHAHSSPAVTEDNRNYADGNCDGFPEDDSEDHGWEDDPMDDPSVWGRVEDARSCGSKKVRRAQMQACAQSIT